MFFNKHKLSMEGVSKETFMKLLGLSNYEVVMSKHDGYFIQKVGLAVGSVPAPHIVHACVS